MKLDKDGWIVGEDPSDKVVRLPVHPSRLRSISHPVRNFVWHWTAGASIRASTAKRIAEGISIPKPPHGNKSWHYLMARDGTLYVQASVFTGTHHVGPGVNGWDLGCETQAAGALVKDSLGVFYAWPYYNQNPAWAKATPEEQTKIRRWGPAFGFDAKLQVSSDRAWFGGDGKTFRKTWWDKHSPEQEETALRLCRALVMGLGWGRDQLHHGHYEYKEINKGKEDPGPYWMGTVLPNIYNLLQI